MPSPNAPGPARDPPLDVRPVLLRVHTELFVTAPVRDRATIETFEALVTGLLPSVDDATAAFVARKLASCPDAPPALLAALERRDGAAPRPPACAPEPPPPAPADARHTLLAEALSERSGLTPATLERLLALDDPEIDRALAGNRRILLTPALLASLVRKARADAALAEELLTRPEPTALDRAALYLHAGPERRARIRAEVAGLTALPPPAPRLAGPERETLLALARRGEMEGVERHLETLLDCGPQDWRFDDPWRHDLLGLTLLAAGAEPDDAIRVGLALPPSLARSGPAVLRFAALVHRTPAPAAAVILAASLGLGRAEPGGTPERVDAAAPGIEPRRDAERLRRAG